MGLEREEEERGGWATGRTPCLRAEGTGRRKVCFGGRELQAAGRRAGGIKPEREFQKERTLSLYFHPVSEPEEEEGARLPPPISGRNYEPGQRRAGRSAWRSLCATMGPLAGRGLHHSTVSL